MNTNTSTNKNLKIYNTNLKLYNRNLKVYNTNTNTNPGKEEDTVDSDCFEYQQSKGNCQKRLTVGQLSTMWFGQTKKAGREKM